MDLFGKSLLDFHLKNPKPLFFKIGDNKFERDVSQYFRRDIKLFSQEELELFTLCNGRTLDIGSGTCNYHFLMKSDVVGIDNSIYLNQIAKDFKAKTINSDIYNFNCDQKFDSFCILGNSLGLGGSLENVLSLIFKMKDLSNPGASAYIIQKDISAPYETYDIEIEYNNFTEKIQWLSINRFYLMQLLNSLNIKSEVISVSSGNYLLRIYNF